MCKAFALRLGLFATLCDCLGREEAAFWLLVRLMYHFNLRADLVTAYSDVAAQPSSAVYLPAKSARARRLRCLTAHVLTRRPNTSCALTEKYGG